MLRSTAEEEEKLDYFHCGYFLTPPSLRDTSPIFLRCKNTVEEEERHFLFQNKNGFVHLSPAMSRSITGYRNLKSKQGKREILPNLPPGVA